MFAAPELRATRGGTQLQAVSTYDNLARVRRQPGTLVHRNPFSSLAVVMLANVRTSSIPLLSDSNAMSCSLGLCTNSQIVTVLIFLVGHSCPCGGTPYRGKARSSSENTAGAT